MKISAVVLAKQEEKNIDRCLKSLEFCDEVIVVDDFSTDKTLERVHKVLKVHKVYKVFQRKLNKDFAEQRNFGMKPTRVSTPPEPKGPAWKLPFIGLCGTF